MITKARLQILPTVVTLFLILMLLSAFSTQAAGAEGDTSGTGAQTETPASYFNPYVSFSANGGGYAVGIADLDNDGLNDVAMTTSTQLLIYKQNADGTLAAPVAYAAGSRPESLAIGDINHDGLKDVIVANFSSNTISIFAQQAGGVFTNRVDYVTNSGPDAVAVGDINGDGLDDIAVSHWNAANIGIFTQNAIGTLNAMMTYASPKAGYDDIAIGDINGDGLNDVVKMNGQGLNPNLSVFTQSELGILDNAVSYSVPGNILGTGIGVGDITGDGKLDIVMSYGGNSPNAFIAVFAQAENGTLQTPVSYSSYDCPEPSEVADINGDGRSDVVVAHGGWNSVSIYLQQSNSTLNSYSRYSIPYASHYESQGMVVGDINHDGMQDIVVADYNNGLVVLYQSLLPTTTPTRTVTATRTITPTPIITSTVTVTPIITQTPIFTPTNTPTQTVTPTSTTHVSMNYYVKPTVSGMGNCQSWVDACTLQTALTNAINGDEIWVAAGTYKPTTNATDRTATFQLKDGVAVYGGFAGTETVRDQRNLATNNTILSGDIDNNDSQTPIITNPNSVTGNTTNSYHIIIGASGAILDGFTITAGMANGSYPDYRGGGIYNDSSSPLLANITFRGNSASWGGGMYNNNASPILINVTFSNNSGLSYGGGIYNDSSNPSLTKVVISGNVASSGGGGVHNYYSNPILTDATISNNTSGSYGGGIYNYYSNPVLTNVTFSGNWTAYDGGGMTNNVNSSPTLTNVTFSGNSANSNGGGMSNNGDCSPILTNVTFSGNSAHSYGGGIYNLSNSNPQIRNTVFGSNTAPSGGKQIYNGYSSSAVVSDSAIQGGCPTGSSCTKIITDDPKLGTLENYDGFTQTIPLLAGSPAIDTGNDAFCPNTDQRGVTRPQGTHCDIGAYEIEYHTISGTLGANGAGATITYDGGSITAGGSGDYSFSVLHGWTGTIAPSKPGYTFAPASITISAPGVTTDLPNQNFTGIINTYTVSGSIGVSGATVAFSGTTSGSATISGSSYSFTVPYGWTGTITPSKAGYSFTPTSITISVPGVTANLPNQNFTAKAVITYTISGSVGSKGAGAVITYTGGSTTASSNGSYSFKVPSGWTGTISPAKTGYTFSPVSISITKPVTANLTNQNFTAKQVR